MSNKVLLGLILWCGFFALQAGQVDNPFGLPPGTGQIKSSDKKSDPTFNSQPKPVAAGLPEMPVLGNNPTPQKPVTQKQDEQPEPAMPAHMGQAPKKEDRSAHVTSGIDFQKMEEEDQDVVDTVNVKETSGNWVFKNYWWRKIEDIYNQIKDVFNNIMSFRVNFFSKRSEVDKELDRFYQQVGLEQGPLEDIINLALKVMEKEKKEQGYLNKKERIFYQKVKNKQHQFEQLKKDIQAMQDLDAKIDQALEVVLQQVDVCSKYEQEAWTIFKDVARELSDKEARKQYYETKGLLQDCNKVYQYLIDPFNSYFDQMVQAVQDHTQDIMIKLVALEKDGIDLKKEVEFFEKEEEPETEKVVSDVEKTKEKTPKTFFRKMQVIVIDYWHQLVERLKQFFFSSKKEVKQIKKEVEKSV